MVDKKVYEKPIITKHHSGMMNKFGSSPITKPKTEIDGVPVKDLLEQYGSPLFVLSEKQIRTNLKNAVRIFKNRYPNIQFAWSYKTNYLNAVCSIYHQEGSWAEVVSGFEYDKARKLGVDGKHIIFNGPDKSDEDLTRAIKVKAKIHIDHADEMYKIIELTEKLNLSADVALRVNMDTGIYPKWDRFGFNYENGEAWQALKRIVINNKLNLVGLHTHIGTYMMTADAYRLAANKLVQLAKSLSDQFDIKLDYIDLGGGFASKNTLIGQYLPAEQVVPTMEQFADAITSEMLEFAGSPDDMPTLILETGRALIDDAGYLLSTVLATKRLSNGKRSIVIDAGVNILFTSFWYKHKILPAQETGIQTENATIYGPLCMNIDVIRDDITLPVLKKDDKIVIHYVGAYEMTQWMQFISLRPNVVMVMEDKTVELIREKEELEDIVRREKLPKQLKTFKL